MAMTWKDMTKASAVGQDISNDLYSKAKMSTAPKSIAKPLAISIGASAPGALFKDAIKRVVAIRPPIPPLAMNAP